MKRGFAVLLIFVSLWGKSQYGGLPEWPFVVGAKDYLHALDNLPNTNIANYTPHAVLKWDNNQSGSIREIAGTAPTSGPDNIGVTHYILA